MIDLARFVQALRALHGTPFHPQGRNAAGVDCAGLVLLALAEQGIDIEAPADYAPSAAGALLRLQLDGCPLLRERPAHDAPQPGDLLLFRVRAGRQPQHLAVLTEPGRMIHATPLAGVREVTLSPLWADRLVAHYGWCDGR